MEQRSRTRYIEAKEQVQKTHGLNFWFSRFASQTAQVVGHPYMFLAAVFVIAFWGFTGPYFHFSDTWQLIINTGTTIITFLMVFLIQSTQNRDAEAVQLKLDELLRATQGAHTALLDIEELSEDELTQLKHCYTTLAQQAAADLRNGKSDLGTPDVKRKPPVRDNVE
jgi:low affinity Fe/Cu permease